MADPWGREGSDRAKMPVELGPHFQAGVWQSQGTGTQGQESSLLAPRTRGLSLELSKPTGYFFFFGLFLVHFLLVSNR